MTWRPRKWLAWGLGGVLALLLAVALIGGAVIGWTLHTTGGAAWVLARVPGLEVTGVRGVLGGEFTAERIEILLPNGQKIVLLDAGWREPALHSVPGVPHGWRLHLRSLHARRVEVTEATRPSPEPVKPPASLRLPISIAVDQLTAGALQIAPATQPLLRDLQAEGLVLGDDAGGKHRLDGVRATLDRWRVAVKAEVKTDAPFALKAEADITQPATDSLPAWQGHAVLEGPLEAPDLGLSVRLQPGAGRPPGMLTARSRLQPFADWPLQTLQAKAQSLDLSVLMRGLPVTSLTGHAELDAQARDKPARVNAEFSNDAPGRWDAGRLPVRRLALELQARPDDLATLFIQKIELQLGNAQQSAGSLSGRGRWAKDGWTFDARLSELQPALLDARAPAMTLSGPLTASGPAQQILERGVEIRAEIAGRFAGKGPLRAAQLSLQGKAARDRIELRTFKAEAGGTRLDAKGLAQRSAVQAPWQVRGEATLADFDPARWWPGPEGSSWRQGPNRLNGRVDVDLRAAAHPLPLQGRAHLDLAPSTLAGVSLSGEANWQSTREGAEAMVKLTANGNAVDAQAHWNKAPTWSTLAHVDHWTAKVDAPALNRLDAWWRLLLPQDALAGDLQADLRVDGQWPAIATQGQLKSNAITLGERSLRNAEARWQVDARPEGRDAPLSLEATFGQAALAKSQPLWSEATASLKGSLQSHQLRMQAQLPQAPPAWMLSAPGATAPSGSRATLEADGRLLAGPASKQPTWTGWQGRLREATWRDPQSPGAAPWARTGEVDLSLQWTDGLRASASPGRAEAFGAVLRWDRAAWESDANGRAPRLDLQAELEPLAVAPWLDRLQPRTGWKGDLMIGGRVKAQSTPSPTIDLQLQRTRGDLSVSDEGGRRTDSLGLSELKMGLQLRDGRWTLSETVTGQSLGNSSGTLSARLPAGAWWPQDDTALDGALSLQVAQLSAWNPWLPAGWRLAGKLQLDVNVAGRYAVPILTGRITGNGLGVRQALQGVDLRDGEVAIALEGGRVRIERFEANGGDGKLSLAGEARFGDAPSAQLTLKADRLQVLGRSDRRIVATGQAELLLDRDNIAVDGRFVVDEGLIDLGRSDAPTMPDDVEVVRPGVQAASKDAVLRRTVKLALEIDLGEKLKLRGLGVRAGLRGKLHIALPDNKLAITGSVQTVDGYYAAYSQQLVIERSAIVFNGPPDNPRLDIEATRPNLDVRVGVHISGTAQAPRIRLFSEPEMAEMEKLSWLILGRGSDGTDGTDAALLQRAALEVLAERTGTTGATKQLGIDEISAYKSDSGSRETVVALGKQLSQRWYLRYERGADTAAGNWQLIYRAASRFTVRAQAGADSAVDVIWTWRWR